MLSVNCWQSKKHPMVFDYRTHFPTFCLNSVYERFNEFALCRKIFSDQIPVKLLDVGCASGEVSRYFGHTYPWVDYTGCDISESAIERAKQKYPHGNFVLTDTDLSQIKNQQFDYVFSRDVIIHQEDPYGFLKNLCSIPIKGLIIRLRTKDKGETVLNVDQSCQLYHEQWIPYMVLNYEELISFFRDLKICSKVYIIKNYMILGGECSRFLPKDCYFEETKTAETTVHIELNQTGSDNMEIVSEVKKGDFEPPFLCKLARSAVKAMTGKSQGKVWW